MLTECGEKEEYHKEPSSLYSPQCTEFGVFFGAIPFFQWFRTGPVLPDTALNLPSAFAAQSADEASIFRAFS